MRASVTFLVLLAVFAGGPTAAGEKPGDPGTNVEMPFLIAPITLGGKLTGYAYISSKVVTISRNASLEVREKIPFIQDAFVRDVNATPIGKAGDPETVDKAVLSARLTADVRRIVGPAKVAGLAVIRIQSTSLHPVEAPSQSALANPPN